MGVFLIVLSFYRVIKTAVLFKVVLTKDSAYIFLIIKIAECY